MESWFSFHLSNPSRNTLDHTARRLYREALQVSLENNRPVSIFLDQPLFLRTRLPCAGASIFVATFFATAGAFFVTVAFAAVAVDVAVALGTLFAAVAALVAPFLVTTVVAFDVFEELLAPLTVRKAAATALATFAPFCRVVVFGSVALAVSVSSFFNCLADGFRVTAAVVFAAAARVALDLNLSVTKLANDDVAAIAAAFAGEDVVGLGGEAAGLRGD